MDKISKMRSAVDAKMTASIVFALFFLILGVSGSGVLSLFMARIICMALLAMAMNLQFGYGGMTNIGGSLIFSLGGYVLMLLCIRFNVPVALSIVLTLILMIPISAFFGYISLRNNMLSFAFCTMGLTMVMMSIIRKVSFFGADTGLPKNISPSWMQSSKVQFVVFYLVGVLCIFIMYLFTKSPFMKMVVGARENDERLTFLGVNIRHLRLTIYIISGLFSVVAGILYAFMNSGAFNSSMDTSVSIQAMLMCVLGGSSVFLGPVVGAIIVTTVMNYVSKWTIYYSAVLGVIIIVCVYFLPEGLLSKNSFLVKGAKKLVIGRQEEKSSNGGEV